MIKQFKPKHRLISMFVKFNEGNLDVTFLLIVLALLTTGLIMLFSAGYSYAYYKYHDSTHFIARQALFAFIGILVMLFISRIDFNCFRTWATVGIVISLILLLSPAC